MLTVLSSKPSNPPRNALAANPYVARLIGLYFQCENRGALPDEGGILDQRGDVMVYFEIFDNARAVRWEMTHE